MIYDKSETEDLFIKGLVAFNNRKFYDAHEYWEDIWRDYKLEHPLIIQGLIQFSVGYFHLSNLNKKGAISLFNKSLEKASNIIHFHMENGQFDSTTESGKFHFIEESY